MSNLVDMWTNGLAKMKDQKGARGEPTSPRAETSEVQSGGAEVAAAAAAAAAPVAYPGLGQALRMKPRPPTALCSDAALSMLECFSP